MDGNSGRISRLQTIPRATCFRGCAAAWWSQFKLKRLRFRKEKLSSDKLKKHMKQDFLPYNYHPLLFQKFHNIRQGSRTVDDYATEFFQMLTQIDIHDFEDQLVARFIAGLKPTLQAMLNQFDPVTVAEGHQRVLVMEKQTRTNTWNSWSTRPRQSTTITGKVIPDQTRDSSR